MPGNRPHHSDKWHSCVDKVMAKGEDEQSASAICTKSLEDAGEPIFEGAAAKSPEEKRMLEQLKEERELQLRGALGVIRTEKWDGVDHLVIPVVALQEGTIQAMNAPTPEFVPEDVLVRSYNLWNGLPLMVDHPKVNGRPTSARARELRDKSAFGLIRNAEVKGKRLGMEVLVNPDKLVAMGEEQLLADLRAGKQVEVSVGVYARTVSESGKDSSGRAYSTKWLEIMPDHLAFLPNGTGACSLEMGCGANRHAGMYLVTASAMVPTTTRMALAFSALDGESLDERMRLVSDAVMEKYREESSIKQSYPTAYVVQYFDDRVILMTNDNETLAVPYEIKDGKAVLGKPEKVKQAWVAAVGGTMSCENCQGTGQYRKEEGGALVDCPMCGGVGEVRAYAGSRHSYSDRMMIQTMHDTAVTLGAKCDENYKTMKSTASEPVKRDAMIRHEGGKWILYSKDGSKKLGVHDTKAEAEAQERAVEAAKQRRSAELARVSA